MLTKNDVLPEAQLRGCLPQLLDLGFIASEQQIVVNDEQGVSWNVLWEWREIQEAWHGGGGR